MNFKFRYLIGPLVFCWMAFLALSDPPQGPMKYNLYTTNNTGAIDAHVIAIATNAVSSTPFLPLAGGTMTGKTTNLFADIRGTQKLQLIANGATYAFATFSSTMNLTNINDGSWWAFNRGLQIGAAGSSAKIALNLNDNSIHGDTFYGGGGGLTNLPVGQVYGGTAAARNAFTPNTSFALWIVTDSTPPFQLSVWSGGVWN